MFKSILNCNKVVRIGIRCLHQKNELQKTLQNHEESTRIAYELVDDKLIENAIDSVTQEKPKSVLEKCEEDLSYIAPYLKPTFNFAAYVNKSETLQELLKLGVQLHKLERKEGVTEFILQLEFEKDIKEHVIFLHDLGVQEVGNFITKNPLIFKESLDDLKTRINYLKYKKFNDEMISRIVSVNPFWLQFSTQKIDFRLGFFQNLFKLTGREVRFLSAKKPKIITYSLNHIKINNFVVKEEMGFCPEEVKTILLEQPAVFTQCQNKLLKTFEYLHKEMQIPLEDIVKCPHILTCREHKLKERYLFLKKLNRVQFDCKKPNYISLLTMVSQTDSYFATEVAKSSIQTYNEFLKSF